MTPDQAFLRAICEDPEDDTPRLIFADWLEERGDPRGEFVRVQCLLAAMALPPRPDHPLRARERELLIYENTSRWLPAGNRLASWTGQQGPVTVGAILGTENIDFHFRRGFVAAITLPTQAFLGHAAALFSAAPIEEVRLSDREPDDWSDSWCWYKGMRRNPWQDDDTGEGNIPAKLWLPWLGIDQVLRRFDTHEAALAALSSWCVDYGRRTVGLPRFAQECPDCGGKGKRGSALDSGEWPCGRCMGTGWIDPD